MMGTPTKHWPGGSGEDHCEDEVPSLFTQLQAIAVVAKLEEYLL